MTPPFRHLYGPVPSRRMGRSLGVDLTPSKTCSFDCIYCQCGCTTRKTTRRDEWVPIEELRDEFTSWLRQDGQADTIAFAGSGEPTLYSRLGEIISFIKERCTIPVAVLSNGSLLHRMIVRDELRTADIVKINLSAWDDASFHAIHRPGGVTFPQIVAGARDFRATYTGQLWIEVFLIDGINTQPEHVAKIAEAAAALRPDKIHLNTAVRPAADVSVHPVSGDTMLRLASLFTPQAEVIASFSPTSTSSTRLLPAADRLAALVRRHPATAEQLAAQFGTNPDSVRAVLSNPPFIAEQRGAEIYYLCPPD